MPDGRRFVATEWHGATINTIPAHVDAVAICRACKGIREVPSRLYRIAGSERMDIKMLADRLRCSVVPRAGRGSRFRLLRRRAAAKLTPRPSTRFCVGLPFDLARRFSHPRPPIRLKAL